MKYISVDCETCGLNPKKHTLLQFGAIIIDTNKPLSFDESPKFEVILETSEYIGTPFALSMHKEIFKELALPSKERTKRIIPLQELPERFAMWLVMEGLAESITKPISIQVAGKNFGSFDLQFLQEQLVTWDTYIKVSHRILDPAILYLDPAIDERLPNLEECKKRAGFTNTSVAHTTLEDAWDVAQLVNYKIKPV